jgi:hypothetical protein
MVTVEGVARISGLCGFHDLTLSRERATYAPVMIRHGFAGSWMVAELVPWSFLVSCIQ